MKPERFATRICASGSGCASFLLPRPPQQRPQADWPAQPCGSHARQRLTPLFAGSSCSRSCSDSTRAHDSRSGGAPRASSQNGAGSSSSAHGSAARRNGSSGVSSQQEARPPRRSRGDRLRKEDIYGGQYKIRPQPTDWVEPWITQTIPEDRLPRWEDLQPRAPSSPVAAQGPATELPTSHLEQIGAWTRLPHHLSREAMWMCIQAEAQEQLKTEPSLAGFVHSYVLMHTPEGLGRALASLLANKLSSRTLLPMQLAGLFLQAYSEDEDLLEACVADLQAVMDRDAACVAFIQPLLFFKGFQALQAYRLAHWLWLGGRKNLAVALQNRMSEVLHVDIHPGATIGRGVLIDHATGVVVGETAVIGDNVSLLHRVTLGGSGVRDGKRHPTIGNGVLLGAAVSVLGPVTVGAAAKVGAGSVVTMDLPPACVAVGVPARIIKTNHTPPTDMDQCDDFIFDYVI